MTFGVIVCPQCKAVKGVNLTNKTTTCIKCGKKLHVDKLKIFFTTDCHEELRQVVGQMNAQLWGCKEEFKEFVQSKK